MIATPPDSVTFFAHVACSGLIRPALVFVSRLTNWANCFPTISGVIVTVRQPIPSPEPTISPACSGRGFKIKIPSSGHINRCPFFTRIVLPTHPVPTLFLKMRNPRIFETTRRHRFHISDSLIVRHRIVPSAQSLTYRNVIQSSLSTSFHTQSKHFPFQPRNSISISVLISELQHGHLISLFSGILSLTANN